MKIHMPKCNYLNPHHFNTPLTQNKSVLCICTARVRYDIIIVSYSTKRAGELSAHTHTQHICQTLYTKNLWKYTKYICCTTAIIPFARFCASTNRSSSYRADEKLWRTDCRKRKGANNQMQFAYPSSTRREKQVLS